MKPSRPLASCSLPRPLIDAAAVSMLSMLSMLSVLSVLSVLAGASPAQEPPLPAAPAAATGWRPLFNGKNLDGWTPKIAGYPAGENHGDTFRVADGVLKVGYAAYPSFDGRFGHLFHEGTFSHYRLRVEYRFVGEQAPGGPGWAFRNSGIMVHGQTPESMAKEQDFPVSIEVQLLGGRAQGERTTANLCTPGTNVVIDGKLVERHCTNSRSATYRGDAWVTVEVEVRGDAVTHIAGGAVVLAYRGAQLDPKDRFAQRLLAAGQDKMLRFGTISLQSESHPVEFRKVEIMELDDGWTDLLGGDAYAKNWHTAGNWRRDDRGVVTLTPREGESGWRRFGSYLWLRGDYASFEFEFDYRVAPRGNSGFYFHVGDENDPVAKGIEVQIYDTPSRDAGARLTDHDSGGIIPGIPPQKSAARPAGQWNRMRVTCHGKRLRVDLNGVRVNDLRLDVGKLKDRPASGAIGFQDHGLPLALRRMRIRRL